MSNTPPPAGTAVLSHSSCIPQEPFVRLGKGQAAELDYNLPQSTCFPVKTYFPVAIPEDYFKGTTQKAPDGNYWQLLDGAKDNSASVVQAHFNGIRGGIKINSLTNANQGESQGNETNSTETGRIVSSGTLGANLIDPDFAAELASKRLRPIVFTNFYGNAVVNFMHEPKSPTPMLVMVRHLKVCSFLGDYGAGKTLKTFSLLPGEETEISIRSFKQITSVKSKAENILDSFSESSTEEMENLIEEETNSTTTQENSNTNTIQKGWNIGGGLNMALNLKIPEIGSVSGGYNFTGGYNNNKLNSETVNDVQTEMVNALTSALDKHVATSAAVREVNVNTETSETATTEEESSTVRKLRNINNSRTLNYVFRQLLQEYLSITYLYDVSFVYSNGYPESKRVVKLGGLEGLLWEILKHENQVKEVKAAIMGQLCSVYDHQGAKVSLVEQAHHKIDNCCLGDANPFEEKYCRIRQDLAQTAEGKTVPGIILNVRKRVLPTDSVVVDSLLGQGEALDCFNQHLQQAAVDEAQLKNRALELENARTEQAMQILDLIPDPVQKAELYKKIFGNCCDTPQTQVIS